MFRLILNSANSLQFRKLLLALSMQTKRTIIPAGTPGTFRPEWGQFPESEAIILAHFEDPQSNRIVVMTMRGWEAEDYGVYAWQYAPVAPPVDGLEAFKAEWASESRKFGYGYTSATGILSLWGCEILAPFPTLAAAQEAAYKHFLSTIQEP